MRDNALTFLMFVGAFSGLIFCLMVVGLVLALIGQSIKDRRNAKAYARRKAAASRMQFVLQQRATEIADAAAKDDEMFQRAGFYHDVI